MILTLQSLWRTNPSQVWIQPEAADRIYEIAASAIPYNAAVVYNRIEYLMNHGRLDEAGKLIELCQDIMTKRPETFVFAAYYAILRKDEERYNRALDRLMALPKGADYAVEHGFVR